MAANKNICEPEGSLTIYKIFIIICKKLFRQGQDLSV